MKRTWRRALKTKHVAAAALDVFTEEPLEEFAADSRWKT